MGETLAKLFNPRQEGGKPREINYSIRDNGNFTNSFNLWQGEHASPIHNTFNPQQGNETNLSLNPQHGWKKPSRNYSIRDKEENLVKLFNPRQGELCIQWGTHLACRQFIIHSIRGKVNEPVSSTKTRKTSFTFKFKFKYCKINEKCEWTIRKSNLLLYVSWENI